MRLSLRVWWLGRVSASPQSIVQRFPDPRAAFAGRRLPSRLDGQSPAVGLQNRHQPRGFPGRATTGLPAVLAAGLSIQPSRSSHVTMSTATTTTSHDTGQHTTSRSAAQPSNTPTSQLERSAAQRLRTTMAAVRLAYTWLGVRKTLAPEQRSTAARALTRVIRQPGVY